MKYLLTLLLFVSISCSAVYLPNNLSYEQYDNLNYAYHFGQQFNKNGDPRDFEKDKEHLGYIFAAIAFKESSGYENPNLVVYRKNHHAYGMFQNYIKTVRNRLKQAGIPKHDNDIIEELLDRGNSAYWSHVELKSWLKVHKGDINKALASYNAGYNWKYKVGQTYSYEVRTIAEYLKSNSIVGNTME